MLLYASMVGHGKNASFAKKNNPLKKNGHFERFALAIDALVNP